MISKLRKIINDYKSEVDFNLPIIKDIVIMIESLTDVIEEQDKKIISLEKEIEYLKKCSSPGNIVLNHLPEDLTLDAVFDRFRRVESPSLEDLIKRARPLYPDPIMKEPYKIGDTLTGTFWDK